jgi:PAS domain S-box-containing protein
MTVPSKRRARPSSFATYSERSGHPVVYVNSAFERLTGRSASDVVNRPFSLMSGDLNPDTVLEEMRWALAHEKPFNTTVHVRRADGRSVWIALSSSPVRDNTGIVTHYVDVFGDVTERIEFERKLIRRTNRLHTVFALSPDGFVTFDENGTVTNVNPAFSRMTHLSQGELLGVSAVAFDRRIAALADPEKPWPELVLDRSTDEPQRLWLLHPEPRVIERSARVAPEGKSETVLYFRDITQQFEVDRLKGEFLSTAAHELRTPLASIFGFAELLINRDYDEPSRRRMHGVIHRQSRVLVNLINDLLDLARIEARAGQDFNLEDESVKGKRERRGSPRRRWRPRAARGGQGHWLGHHRAGAGGHVLRRRSEHRAQPGGPGTGAVSDLAPGRAAGQ